MSHPSWLFFQKYYKYLWSCLHYMQSKSQNVISAKLKTFNTYVRCTVISIKCKCYKTKQVLKPENYIDKNNLARLKSCFFNRLPVHNIGIQSRSISLLITPKLTRFLTAQAAGLKHVKSKGEKACSM